MPVHTFQIACGAGGAFVDVSTLVLTDQGGLVRSRGRKSSFVDAPPGTFSFTLDNRDGRFTPDTTNAGATPLQEGQVVSWQTDTRLVSGKISVGGLQLIFGDPGVAATARIRVTVADALGQLAQHTLPASLANAMVMGSSPFAFWPLNDALGAITAAEATGNGFPIVPSVGLATLTFGAAAVPAAAETQLQLVSGVPGGSVQSKPAPVVYPNGSLGFTGCWLATSQANALPSFIGTSTSFLAISSALGFPTVAGEINLVGLGPLATPAVVVQTGVANYFSVGVTYTKVGSNYTYTVTLYQNGLAVATVVSGSTTAVPPTTVYGIATLNNAAETETISHLSHTAVLVHEEWAGITTETIRLKALAAASPEITLTAPPATLSPQPIGVAAVSGQSVLDAFNDVMRTEQGQIDVVTAGTVGAPVPSVTVRGRDRPTAITATWVSTDKVQDASLVRDLSNTVSEVDVNAAGGVTATVLDAVLKQRLGSANVSFKVLSSQYLDAYTAGTDRLNRGRKVGLDVESFSTDGMSGTDRHADLLGLTFGDRHEVSGLPNAQLGYSTWDGFLIGVDETWTSVTALFRLWLEPAGPRTAVFDTDLFMADGALSLSSALTAGAVSMSVATSVPAVGNVPATLLALTGAGTPYTLQIDQEQVIVTACTNATPQVATITRGANGTTAAAHAAGALIEVATRAQFPY